MRATTPAANAAGVVLELPRVVAEVNRRHAARGASKPFGTRRRGDSAVAATFFLPARKGPFSLPRGTDDACADDTTTRSRESSTDVALIAHELRYGKKRLVFGYFLSSTRFDAVSASMSMLASHVEWRCMFRDDSIAMALRRHRVAGKIPLQNPLTPRCHENSFCAQRPA
jgi:hypothetical protein